MYIDIDKILKQLELEISLSTNFSEETRLKIKYLAEYCNSVEYLSNGKFSEKIKEVRRFLFDNFLIYKITSPASNIESIDEIDSNIKLDFLILNISSNRCTFSISDFETKKEYIYMDYEYYIKTELFCVSLEDAVKYCILNLIKEFKIDIDLLLSDSFTFRILYGEFNRNKFGFDPETITKDDFINIFKFNL